MQENPFGSSMPSLSMRRHQIRWRLKPSASKTLRITVRANDPIQLNSQASGLPGNTPYFKSFSVISRMYILYLFVWSCEMSFL